MQVILGLKCSCRKIITKKSDTKIALLIYFLKRRFDQIPSLVVLALGFQPAVECSAWPWGTKQHKHSASAISTQSQHGSGKLLLRASTLATFHTPQGALWSTVLHSAVPVSCSQAGRVEAVGWNLQRPKDCSMWPKGIWRLFKFRRSLNHHADIAIVTFCK